jgi:ribosomal protein S18 acetylase RimI-like enzyme
VEPTATADRVRAELRGTLESVADSVLRAGPGWVVRTPTLPLVRALNQVRIDEPADFADCLAFADVQLRGVPFRYIVIEDGEVGRRLEEPFRAAGWKVDREVMMALTAPADRNVDTEGLVELSEVQMLGLMRLWAIEEHGEMESERLAQLDEFNLRSGRLWHEDRFGVIDDSGAPVAVAKLRIDHSTGWIEDVYTVPGARHRGYARMLVSHAAAIARSSGADLTFITADDNDWPKDLYSKIGFRPVGYFSIFHSPAGT